MKCLITHTKELSSPSKLDEQVNEYLKLGWIIVESWVMDNGMGNDTGTPHALLGWIDRVSPPRYPERGAEYYLGPQRETEVQPPSKKE